MNMKTFTRLILFVMTLISPMALLGESLWKKADQPGSMFADSRARSIGDIVTIVVQESATISATKSATTNKSSEVADAVQQILKAGSGATTGFPSNAWNNNSDFSGGGSVSDSQSAQSQLSVIVVDRLPNGNLAIEGMRRVTMANEINYAVIRGFIRPQDVREDNTILSSRIADAQVDFIAEGSLTEAQRKGWLNRFQSIINPF